MDLETRLDRAFSVAEQEARKRKDYWESRWYEVRDELMRVERGDCEGDVAFLRGSLDTITRNRIDAVLDLRLAAPLKEEDDEEAPEEARRSEWDDEYCKSCGYDHNCNRCLMI